MAHVESLQQKQLTVRSAIAGMMLGGFMSLSNLYVSLKTGWSMGVSITAGILAFAIFSLLLKMKVVRTQFGMLENNAMQSVASAAGYMTGGGTVAAIPALMMITGETMGGFQMFIWIATIAMLGVVVAIPMKQQMINIEKLRFPTGTAAAETLQALHSHSGENTKAKFLGWAGVLGAFVGFFRDAHATWMPFNFPAKFKFPGTISGRPLSDFTFAFEGSLILIGAGAIMGFRAAWSMLLGALVNYGILAPSMYEQGVISEALGYKNIVSWSVWFGSAMILTSGLLAFSFQWKTVVRAVKSVGQAFGVDNDDGIREVPMSWFFIGVAIFAPIVIFLQWYFFGIKVWMGALSVFMSFFIAIVACRATGETDTTPTGALGKLTQITFGAVDAGNVTTNLMTANVTAGVALHSADLLTDLKSGYILKADPRQQFYAQFLGVLAGSLFVVPAYHLLIPTPDVLGTDQWPAPGAQTWRATAELLVKGLDTLHPTAQWSILIGGLLGIALVLFEHFFPRFKKYTPSPTGLGLAFTMPAYNSIAFFIGALIALVVEKKNPALAEKSIVPVSSGFIAGESLMGVAIAILVVLGVLM